ncbi:MAG: universal stress protein [Planctomycetota bacterium]|nr:MAG: universal stress protein [Planctomycetota bacterium]
MRSGWPDRSPPAAAAAIRSWSAPPGCLDCVPSRRTGRCAPCSTKTAVGSSTCRWPGIPAPSSTSTRPSSWRCWRIFLHALPESKPIRNVLVATDFSPQAEAAGRAAADLAGRLGARIHLVHALPVWDPHLDFLAEGAAEALRAGAEDRLEREATALGVEGERLVRPGHPIDVVLESAHRLDADLLVVGTSGRSGLAHFALGSVAERIAQSAPRDVLLVREPPAEGFRHPLLALAPGPSGLAAAARAAAVVPTLDGASLVAVSAYDLPLGFSEAPSGEEEAAERMRERIAAETEPVREALAAAIPGFEARFERGRPCAVVQAAAERADADLVLLGTRARSRWSALLLGRTARSLVHRLPCSVWLVRDLSERHPILDAIARDLGLE